MNLKVFTMQYDISSGNVNWKSEDFDPAYGYGIVYTNSYVIIDNDGDPAIIYNTKALQPINARGILIAHVIEDLIKENVSIINETISKG